jgi:hypothetical protein
METKRPLPGNGSSLPFAGRIGGNQQFTLPSADTTASALPFAGRIGGNQDFTTQHPRLSISDADLVKKTPDAAPLLSLRDVLDLKGFSQPIIWKAAIIECWGKSSSYYLVHGHFRLSGSSMSV